MDTAGNADASSSRFSPRQSYHLTVFCLGAFVAFGHWRRAEVWPLQGVWLFAGLLPLALLAFLNGCRVKISLDGLALPALALTLFAAWAWLRTVFSDLPSAGYGILGFFIQGIAFFWLGVYVVRGAPVDGDRRKSKSKTPSAPTGVRLAAVFFSCLAALAAFHAILQYHIIYPAQYQILKAAGEFEADDLVSKGVEYALQIRRVSSQFGNPNLLCGFLAMCLPLIVATGWGVYRQVPRNRRGWVAVGLSAVVGMVLYAAFRTGSVGGWAVMLVGIMLVLAAFFVGLRKGKRGPRRSRKKPSGKSLLLVPLLVAVVSLCFAVYYVSFPVGAQTSGSAPAIPENGGKPPKAPVLTSVRALEPETEEKGLFSFLKNLRQAATIQQRLYYLRIGFRIWRQSPLAGKGVGGYERYYSSERILGAGETRYAHNFPMQLAVETGLAGLGLFLWFLFLLGKRFWTGLKSGEADVYWLATAGALFLFLLDSLGEYIFYQREVFQDFCLLAGVFCAAAPDAKRSGEESGATSISFFTRSRLFPIGVLVLGFLFVAGTAWRVNVSPMMSKHYHWLADSALKELRRNPPLSAYERDYLLLDARRMSARALLWEPVSREIRLTHAHVNWAFNETGLAVKELTEAAEMFPLSASVRSQLASYYWALGDREKALDWMGKAISRNPKKSTLYVQRGQYQNALGKKREAWNSARVAERLAFSPREKKESRSLVEELGKQ